MARENVSSVRRPRQVATDYVPNAKETELAKNVLEKGMIQKVTNVPIATKVYVHVARERD